jgi:hypothetical protein
MGAPKQIVENVLIGQRGVNLIEQILLDMGFTWHPTNQALEAGLDGFLEIRDQETGQVFNSVIFVQSRATDRPFTAETDKSFEYLCDQRDLDYWMKGNAPIVLVRSRPSTSEAYWISIKDYFKELSVRTTRKIVFDKALNKFDENARTQLIKLAVPPGSGIYLPARPKEERLYSNLLGVRKYPSTIWSASTSFRWDAQISGHFREKGIRMGHEWILKDKNIYSFYDLSSDAWQDVCDQGTVESHTSSDWGLSTERSKRDDFIRLLNLSLHRKLHHLDVEFHKKHELFYFRLPQGMSSWREPYRSIAKQTSRFVVEHHPNKNNPDLPGFYKHLAFGTRFVEIDHAWFLQLLPSYYYTRDGYRALRRYEELLKGMKRLERNSAVLGQVIFIADYLSRPTGLFRKSSDLEFGELAVFPSEVGIIDRDWLPQEDDEGASIERGSDSEMELFA